MKRWKQNPEIMNDTIDEWMTDLVKEIDGVEANREIKNVTNQEVIIQKNTQTESIWCESKYYFLWTITYSELLVKMRSEWTH